jgi:uncharacterized glyoxalase superfamily protein PhnB
MPCQIMQNDQMNTKESMYPVVIYRDADAALEFLARVFGFEETAVHRNADGTVVHAEMAFGSGALMMGQSGTSSVQQTSPTFVYVSVESVDSHYRTAVQGGAKITQGPADTDYGTRDYAAEDSEGNYWHFGTYQPA